MDDGEPELISMSEAARRLGIAPSTLSRQVKRQIVRSHGGKVVLSEVIADQRANIDPHLANRRKAPVALIVASESSATPDATPAVATPFTLARTSKEEATAALRRLEVEEKLGLVVNRAAAETEFYKLARDMRDAWLSWPARIAVEMANDLKVDPRILTGILTTHVNSHLTELGEAVLKLR